MVSLLSRQRIVERFHRKVLLSDNGGMSASIFAENWLPALPNGLSGNNSPLEEDLFNYCNRGVIWCPLPYPSCFQGQLPQPWGTLGSRRGRKHFRPDQLLSPLLLCCPNQPLPFSPPHTRCSAGCSHIGDSHLSPLVPQWREDSCLQCVGQITPSPNDNSQGRRGKEEEAPKI